jgi:hypothetical protein
MQFARLADIALYVDPRVDGIAIVTFNGRAPYVIGSESAYGSLFAVNLARAHVPDGVLGLGVAMDDGARDGLR